MPKKKQDNTAEETSTEVNETEATEGNSVEAQGNNESAGNENTDSGEIVGNTDTSATDSSLIGSVFSAVTSAVSNVAEAVVGGATDLVNAVTGDDNADSEAIKKTSKRAEKIGTVQSDKMTKTVTVRVDRVLKHPMYRKYIKRRKKFMAHDELGAKIGDKVRIIETRPLSAKKRWRVVEIIQKAER